MSRNALSQYYTKPEIWSHLVNVLKGTVDLDQMTIVDPCAGDGSMIDTYFPTGYKFDLDPKSDTVIPGDMETLDYGQFGRRVAIVTNIPFNASDFPIRKMNQMAKHGNVEVIAVINASKYEYHPVDSKDRTGSEFNANFHLVHCEPVPSDGFNPPVTIEVSFQIWIRKSEPRKQPETVFIVDTCTRLADPEWIVCAPSRAFLKGMTCISPVQHITDVKKRAGMNYFAVKPNPKAVNLVRGEKSQIEEIITSVYSKFHHGSQGFAPGHFIREMYALGMFV